jgi:DNA-binding MarR family transcriptional regulator
MSEASVPPLTTTSLLMRAQRNCRTAMDAALQAHALSTAQYGVLRRLGDDPGLSGAELARRLHVTAQTMNRLVAALEEAGLIERFPDAAGGRTLRARLTTAGGAAVDAARRTVEAVEARMLVGLDAREQVLLARMLRRCAEALELPSRASEASDWQPRVIGAEADAMSGDTPASSR